MGFLIDYIKDGLSISGSTDRSKTKQPSLIRDFMKCPDNFTFEGKVEDGEIRITVRRNEKVTLSNEG